MTLFYIFIVVVTVIAGTWILIPIFYGVPWRPTRRSRIRKALKLAELRPNETIYDLGAGDGRVLILAAQEFGARGVGIEAGILQWVLAGWMARVSGVSSRVRVTRGNLYRADLHEADVVFAYLTSDQVFRLQPSLATQLKKGARVVTIALEIPGWQPDAIDRDDLIFMYRMPPTEGNLLSFLASRG